MRILPLLGLVLLTALRSYAAERALPSPSQQYSAWALRAIDNAEKNLPEITRVAEFAAERHLKGGMIGFPWNAHSLQQELAGRAGGMMNIDFDRAWKDRSPEGDKYNMAIIGWDRAPWNSEGDLAQLKKLREAGVHIIGFGPRDLPALAEHIKLCDTFFDTGLGADDRVVLLPNGDKAGRGNALINMLNGWAFIGEMVAALTRHGKMPVMWKSFMYPDGHAWMDKYFRQKQFHDEFTIAPIARGTITRSYFNEIRDNIRRFQATQNGKVLQAAGYIVDEMNAGRKTIVAGMGHAPGSYVGHYEDARWGVPFELETVAPAHIERYQQTPEGALVLRLGYGGMDKKSAEIFAAKKQRVIFIHVPDERPEFQNAQDVLMEIDMGWKYGDAVVSVPGYPIKLIPPSGIMQIVAYESVNTEVLARLPAMAEQK